MVDAVKNVPVPKPQPHEIIALAKSLGFSERRSEVSFTLFFREDNPAHGMPPVLVSIYYTTRSIMTYLNHPSAGSNELWRSNAYTDLEGLKSFLENPRRHSGKGYRNKNKAVRGCANCGEFKKRNDFSKNQWAKGPDVNKCRACVDDYAKNKYSHHDNNNAAVNGSPRPGVVEDESVISELSDALSGVQIDEFPSLTSDLLDAHDSKNKRIGNKKQELERRQYNCPQCPKQGRGKHIFFKKVPIYKPVVKCPQCKRVNQGKCLRLYPVPKASEKGYGLFRCYSCKDVWGSSRAVSGIGQNCFKCEAKGKTIFVKPFRLEVIKPRTTKSGGILGGGPRTQARRMRKVPKDPIGEERETNTGYTDGDHKRNQNAAGNALTGRHGINDGEGRSYKFEPRADEESLRCEDVPSAGKPKVGIPKGFTHKCEGCATGVCKSRYLPKSLVHDVSDGNTVSTSASIMTNSSIDKADFIDRDQDFTGFELDEEDWIQV